MKTVDKAMTVLDQFTLENREVGLTELSKLAGLDKAATRRLLLALAKHGFVEQARETRKYRLGLGFLRLARVREATVPMERVAQEVADWLALKVNDTVHVSVPGSTERKVHQHHSLAGASLPCDCVGAGVHGVFKRRNTGANPCAKARQGE